MPREPESRFASRLAAVRIEERARILIIDGDPGVRETLQRLVQSEGHLATVATDAAEARTDLASGSFELVLCDVGLVHDAIGDRTDVAVLRITKPLRDADVTVGIANALRSRCLAERAAELEQSREKTIHCLAAAAEHRDGEIGKHIERVSRYSELIARGLGLPQDRCELLRIASPLHDIGKIAIPDLILRKPAPLSADERRVVETHTELGHSILAGSSEPLLELGAEIAWTHHERFDGKGYPRGLAGDSIPLAGRLVAVADVFDALVSDRVYRAALPVDEVVAVMRSERGFHFDPDVLDALLTAIPEALAIRDRFSDERTSLRLVSS